MDVLLIVCLLVSFLVTLFLTKWWIKRAHRVALVGKDMNKYEKNKVAEIGGLPVLIGFLIGVLLYVGYRTFIRADTSFNVSILGVSATIMIIAIIGLMDDLLGWKLGLRQYQKPILIFFAAMPMMMINAGKSVMNLPLVGFVDLGIIYPLLIIPIGIAAAANGFNMLAGYNGLEAGQGIIILTVLGFIAWFSQGLARVAMIAFVMVAALIAFLYFNGYPARVFPGNTLTFTVGALIAMIAILGNAEKAAVVLFIPYFFEFFLKSRGGWQKESFGKPLQDGSLELLYKKIYGLGHFFIWFLKKFKKKVYEYQVVYSIYFIEIVIAFIVLGFVFF